MAETAQQEHGRAEALPRLREIVCPTDFSPASAEALEMAAALARRMGAHVSVVHVVDHRRDRDAAEARLRSFVAAHAAGAAVAFDVLVGHPPHQIGRFAQQHHADLILLGTHGRETDSLIPMSVAQQIQAEAPCPVLAREHFHDPDTLLDRLQPRVAPEMRCLVCTRPSTDLICQGCRALIRGEVLERRSRRQKWPGYDGG